MQELNCSKCGANLKFDPISKMIVCPFCGQVDEDLEEQTVTLGQVDQAINNGEFGKASRLVVALKKRSSEPDPRLTLRSIYCSFQSKNISELLTKNPKDATYYEKILDHPAVKQLEEELPVDKKDLVVKVNEYCGNSMAIIAGVSDQGKRKQFEKVRKEGKMIKLPTLKNASYEENYNWLWIVLGVIIGFVLTISVGGNDNASDSFSVFEFFILFTFFTALAIFALWGLGSFYAILSAPPMKESAWEKSAEGGKDELVKEEDIEKLQSQNKNLLLMIEALEKDVR